MIDAIESAEGAHAPVERERHCLIALAAVSRCRSLLLGILELDKAGRGDLLGILNRAVLEVWYFGVIGLLGDEADLDRLEADHRYWNNALATQMQGVEPDAGASAKYSVFARAKRADELLVAIGKTPGRPVEWYRQIYAADSLTQAHAGFESLAPYVYRDDDGSIGIEHDPYNSTSLRYGRISISTMLTAMLAGWTWERVGLDGTVFDRIGHEVDKD